jgi:flagellar assembly factor FliW
MGPALRAKAQEIMEGIMVIETKDLGFVEIDEREIITFSHAIYGFEGAARFVLLSDKTKRDNPFMWLQCVDMKEPCFAVIDPHAIFSDYMPVLTAEDREAIGLSSAEYLRYAVLATVPKNIHELYVNLKCPIVINSQRNIAMQVILENSDYPMRYYVFKKVGG